MNTDLRRWLTRGGIAAALIALAVFIWQATRSEDLPDGIASGNGRIEAVEIDISAKTPGRIREILVNEGDFVKQGQVVARMDTDVLQAQRAEAQAQLDAARNNVAIARSQLAQQESNRAAAVAVVRQREAELDAARKRLSRSTTLAAEGATSEQERDDDEARVEGALAAVEASRAQVAAAESAIAAARSQIVGAQSQVEAGAATIRRVEADITDSDLKSPRDGRIQYRVAQPGEVVGGGGRVLNLVDLSDVYMTFFLPETVAGRVALGSEVHIVLDTAPEYVIPAEISFVADVAQFTPKTVETESERQKLMFRVKARIDQALLRENITQVKTGLPGVAYVRVSPDVEWPAELEVNVPR